MIILADWVSERLEEDKFKIFYAIILLFLFYTIIILLQLTRIKKKIQKFTNTTIINVSLE